MRYFSGAISAGLATNAPSQELSCVDDVYVGTPDYSSKSSLLGTRQGPSDDLESLGFSLLELVLGDLPWRVT